MAKLKYGKNIIVIGIIAGIFAGWFAAMLVFDMSVHNVCPKSAAAGCDDVTVVPLVDRDYFREVDKLIASSNRSIYISMFSMKYYTNYRDSHENLLLDSLIAANKRGVDVRIIIDEWGTDDDAALKHLSEGGINIKYDSPDLTTHTKIIIIDGRIVVVGSTNWSYYAIDENHEANVVVHSEIIGKYFENYFEKIWEES